MDRVVWASMNAQSSWLMQLSFIYRIHRSATIWSFNLPWSCCFVARSIQNQHMRHTATLNCNEKSHKMCKHKKKLFWITSLALLQVAQMVARYVFTINRSYSYGTMNAVYYYFALLVTLLIHIRFWHSQSLFFPHKCCFFFLLAYTFFNSEDSTHTNKSTRKVKRKPTEISKQCERKILAWEKSYKEIVCTNNCHCMH